MRIQSRNIDVLAGVERLLQLAGRAALRRNDPPPLALLLPELPIDHVNRLRLALCSGNDLGLERHLLQSRLGRLRLGFRSIFIRRTFNPVQNATSVSAPASPVCIHDSAQAGLVL